MFNRRRSQQWGKHLFFHVSLRHSLFLCPKSTITHKETTSFGFIDTSRCLSTSWTNERCDKFVTLFDTEIQTQHHPCFYYISSLMFLVNFSVLWAKETPELSVTLETLNLHVWLDSARSRSSVIGISTMFHKDFGKEEIYGNLLCSIYNVN